MLETLRLVRSALFIDVIAYKLSIVMSARRGWPTLMAYADIWYWLFYRGS